MSDDYYSYAPLLRLQRPVALVGLPGSDVGRVGRAMNLMAGVPFVWVDRHIEHLMSRSVELVQRESGAEARLEYERILFADVLTRRVPHILALSDVTYEDAALRDGIESACDVILLHIDVNTALARVQAQGEADSKNFWALREGGMATPEVIRSRIVAQANRYRHLSRVVLVGDRSPLAVAEQVLGTLGFEVPKT